jgi:GNAT superfamily N-acetyltransferase
LTIEGEAEASTSGAEPWRPGARAAALAVDYLPAGDPDLEFLEAVYVSTRAQEVAATGWPEESQRQFLGEQFSLQHRHYRTHYAGAHWLIVLQGETRVGRLYIVRWPAELRIIDIALLPQARGRGIGSAILADLLAEAHAQELAVSIHVERNNPALSLYLRLGFAKAGEHGIYDLMRAEPPGRDVS